ncbi:GT19 [Symbiodinium pilosum]|uniref:GT19 protein n=1 Tax=Symbiodinium pilosum TaxID=2952 RepID=A0A812J8C0_SYMPI|nr:GT19 [Symbiodinium pilosum]
MKPSEGESYARIAAVKLQSTFCVEPPGDTITRKSLVDSIVLGCIPVVFAHQELDMFEPFLTAQQFRAIAYFVPEAEVVGSEQQISIWGFGTFGGRKQSVNKKLKLLRELYPEYAELLSALHPRFSETKRLENVKRLFPSPTPMLDILLRVTEDEVRKKQEVLAQVAHRLVIGLDDSSEDAVRILLDKIVSNDQLALRMAQESPM